MTSAVAVVMAFIAALARMRSRERPPGQRVVERVATTRPAHELRVSTEVLDVASTAIASAILGAVKSAPRPNPPSEIPVTVQARGRRDASSARVTACAVSITVDLVMIGAQGAGAQKLTLHAVIGHEQARHGERADEEPCRDRAAAHSKIHR